MLDRREFLLTSAVSVLPTIRSGGCRFLVEPGNPLAAESLRGYRRRLRESAEARLIVVPGFRKLSAGQLIALQTSVLNGACVVLETGLAFASGEEIAAQSADLWNHFGIRIAPQLSKATGGFRYIRYHWPIDTMVRDFSAAVVLEPGSGEPIGSAAGQVLAIRRHDLFGITARACFASGRQTG